VCVFVHLRIKREQVIQLLWHMREGKERGVAIWSRHEYAYRTGCLHECIHIYLWICCGLYDARAITLCDSVCMCVYVCVYMCTVCVYMRLRKHATRCQRSAETRSTEPSKLYIHTGLIYIDKKHNMHPNYVTLLLFAEKAMQSCNHAIIYIYVLYV
jgi:hypothetical protein